MTGQGSFFEEPLPRSRDMSRNYCCEEDAISLIFIKDYTDAFFDDRGNDKERNSILLLGTNEIGAIGYDDLDQEHRTVDLDIWMKEGKYCGHG